MSFRSISDPNSSRHQCRAACLPALSDESRRGGQAGDGVRLNIAGVN